MKKNNINNRKQRYNLFVEESARVLGGYMMTTEEMTRKQLEKFMVKIARQYVKSNCEKGESYKLIAETTEDAGEMLVISVEAFRATWSRAIMVNVYDFDAESFTTWWSEKKAPKTEEEPAEVPAEVVENESECVTVYRHTTAEKVAAIARTIADAVGVCFGSSFPASDMVYDLARFASWQHGESTPEIMDASAAFFFAVRKQGSESGRVAYVRERCRVLGAPVYVLKVEREEVAGFYTLRVRVASPTTGETVADAWEAKKEDNEGENGTESEGSAQRLASVAADYMAGTLDSVKRYAKKAGETAAAAFFRLVGALLIALQIVGGISAMACAGYVAGLILPGGGSLPLLGITFSFLFILAATMGAAFVLVRATQYLNKLSNYRLLPYNY